MKPNDNGEIRNSKGQFVKGAVPNPAGRPKGALSITDEIKRKLDEVPVGSKRSRLEELVEVVFHKALVEKDERMLKAIWSYVDGLPRQAVELGNADSLPFSIVVERDTSTRE